MQDKTFWPSSVVGHQQRADRSATHDGAWYDKSGVQIGYGDLDGEDLAQVAALLPPNDVFILLSIMHHRFSEQHDIDYLGKTCHIVIEANKCYCVIDNPHAVATQRTRGGCTLEALRRGDVPALLQSKLSA